MNTDFVLAEFIYKALADVEGWTRLFSRDDPRVEAIMLALRLAGLTSRENIIKTTIDLQYFTRNNILMGQENGKYVRMVCGLDELDPTTHVITVLIPTEILSVNSSFFIGMFGESIKRLGELTFSAKYEFVGKDIRAVIADAIQECLR